MKTNLKIYTSFINRENIEKIVERELLPIFIVRSIGKFDYLEKWSNTPLHFRELSPSYELYWLWRDGKIDYELFCKRFIIELSSLDFQDIVLRLENLAKASNARGVVLLGIGENKDNSHRTIISDILWETKYLIQKPEELIL